MDIKIAFYKGEGKLLDKLIRFTSRGLYSHVEIIEGEYSYGASGRDGGVRRKSVKEMNFDDNSKWDIFLLNVPDNDNIFNKVSILHKMYNRCKYDYFSIIVYHLLRLYFIPKFNKNTYICTDYVINILNRIYKTEFKNGEKLSPDNVYVLLSVNNLIY